MRLSICMIVRDEAANLAQTLDSVKDIADEIVICDTGSQDATKEVAARYTGKIYDVPWEDDFSKARNAAKAHCTGDWILSLDADEVVENAQQLRAVVEKCGPDVQMVLPMIVMCHDDGTEFQRSPGERIFRNLPTITWHGPMHNWLDVPCEGENRLAVPDLRIIHNRGGKPGENRARRNQQRVEMAEKHFIAAIEADPTDRRSLFYLAGTYYDAAMYDKCIPWYEKYMEVSDWGSERYQAGLLLGDAHRTLGNRAKARRVLSQSIQENYQRAEAHIALGEMALEDGDTDQAIVWFKQASLLAAPFDAMFVDVASHTWKPHYGLHQCYLLKGDVENAKRHAVECVNAGVPPNMGIHKWLKNRHDYACDKVMALVDRGQMNFVQPLLEKWADEGADVRAYDHMPADIDTWPDVIWCEWAGDLAIEATKAPKNARVIVRVHGYETHSGHVKQVNWQNVNDVIFVADYLRELALRDVPCLNDLTNVHVIGGGVETDKFSIAEGKTGKRIAMACYGNTKKNLPMALEILAKLPDHELHIATEWQDDRLQMYFWQLADQLGLRGRVFEHPWQDDLNEFYKDKDFYLSASMEESFHYALAEGMAAGLKPVIHCWKSSDDFYKPEWIYRTVDEAVAMLQDAGDSREWRQYAAERLDVRHNIRKISRIVERPAVAVAGQPRYVHAFEHKLLLALEQLGCRTDAPIPDTVILTGREPQLERWMRKCKKVLWYAEYIGADPARLEEAQKSLAAIVPQLDMVVVTYPGDVDHFRNMGAKRVEQLTCAGACTPWQPLPNVEKKYDVGFYGYLSDRRLAILEELGKHFEVCHFEEHDHTKLNWAVNQCKVMVNVHFSDEPYLPTRIFECMAAGACVVSEPMHTVVPCVTTTSDLASTIKRLLDDDAELAALSKAAHEWVWKHHRLDQQAERMLELCSL